MLITCQALPWAQHTPTAQGLPREPRRLTHRLLSSDTTCPGLRPAETLTQRGQARRSWASAWVSLPTVQGPLQRLEEWTAEKFCSEGTGGHSPGLIYFDLLAPTFSCLFCPFKIIECEGWLTLTTSVFWSWVRTPYRIVPCGPPATA